MTEQLLIDVVCIGGPHDGLLINGAPDSFIHRRPVIVLRQRGDKLGALHCCLRGEDGSCQLRYIDECRVTRQFYSYGGLVIEIDEAGKTAIGWTSTNVGRSMFVSRWALRLVFWSWAGSIWYHWGNGNQQAMLIMASMVLAVYGFGLAHAKRLTWPVYGWRVD